MGRFKTKEFLSQTVTAQVVFNLVFLYTETLLIAENVVAVYSYSLFASLGQQTSNMETKGKFRRVLKKRNVQFYSCRICMKIFGIVNDWTTIDKGVRDIVIEVISTHYHMISQQISKWANKKGSPRLILRRKNTFARHRLDTWTWVVCTRQLQFTHVDSLLDNPGGGGTPHMKGVGMLVGNFELNP